MKKTLKKTLINRIKKVSSMDMLSLFFVFFVAAGAYFFLSRKTEYLEITVRLLNQDTPEYYLDTNQTKAWYVQEIEVGKAQKSSFGEKSVEITDVYSYPNGFLYNDVYVTLRLKTTKNKITGQYIYEGSPLLIHDIKSFKIKDLLLNGEIIDIKNKATETKKLKISFELLSRGANVQNNSEAVMRGIENYTVDLIKEGMLIKDNKGQELVRINKVIKKPGEVILATPNGLQRLIDPDRTRVIIETDLLAEKVNNYYFYRKEETLLIDQIIHLTFDGIVLIGKIVSIEGM